MTATIKEFANQNTINYMHVHIYACLPAAGPALAFLKP